MKLWTSFLKWKNNFYIANNRTAFALLWIISFFVSLASGCRATDEKNDTVANVKNELLRPRGKLDGKIELTLRRTVVLDSRKDGFIQSLWDLEFQNNRFYALDRIGAAITVFDSTGNYLQTMDVDRNVQFNRLLTELIVLPSGDIYTKDEYLRTVYHLNPKGKIVSKIQHAKHGKGEVLITLGGLGLVQSDSDQILYSTIFNDMNSKEYLTKSNLIASFDSKGNLIAQFAKHAQNYARFNLVNFSESTFTIWKNEIYFLEAASHKIRVFSLGGTFLRSFGTYGLHQRVIDRRLKNNATMSEIKQYVLSYSAFDKIFVCPHLLENQPPAVVVTYRNPLPSQKGSESRYYLKLYQTDGHLLLNDLELPGKLFSVVESKDGRTIMVNLDNSPIHREIGFFKLKVTP